MESLFNYIRKMAADVEPKPKSKSENKIRKILIFFKDVGESLTTEEDRSLEENFQWVQYSVIFTKGEKFYLFRSPLSPDGEKFKDPEVLESDSGGKEGPTADISSDEVIRMFPKILKGGPVLQYDKLNDKIGIDESDVTYFDAGRKTPGGPKFTVEEFKKVFYPKEDDKGKLQYYYIVFSVHQEKVGPDGTSVPPLSNVEKVKEENPAAEAIKNAPEPVKNAIYRRYLND